jgi:signal transduction histidine kinase
MAGTPVRDAKGTTDGAVAVFMDVTLEHEMARTQSDFVAFAGKQITIPLEALAAALETFARGNYGPLSSPQAYRIRELATEARRIPVLVRDLRMVKDE